ncbi:hypothetical protein [Roseimicrobium sp. ORNL1]|uniref:hypothetical protein n=1 Tax=Roseimicrobium sp. ORNL1 TaxID=2711231 RepID=UPI0013E1702C|nr:hypothetical protein [Roseimicrobium sp. ORNL1]QIF01975.1 hypothetical protein G5S37_10680 [Roseimicrobium sp. ORNL1]
MSTSHSAGRTRTLPWLLACILPLLYLLSIAPVTLLTGGSWVEYYRAPYEWAYENTRFGGYLHRYEFWWNRMLSGFIYPTEFDPPSVPQRPPAARPRAGVQDGVEQGSPAFDR